MSNPELNEKAMLLTKELKETVRNWGGGFFIAVQVFDETRVIPMTDMTLAMFIMQCRKRADMNVPRWIEKTVAGLAAEIEDREALKARDHTAP
jgi:hypothetical protein